MPAVLFLFLVPQAEAAQMPFPCTASLCHQPQPCMAGAAQNSSICCDGLAACPSSLGFLVPSSGDLHWNQPLYGAQWKTTPGRTKAVKVQNMQNKRHRSTYLVTSTVAYQPLCVGRHRTRLVVWCPTKNCTLLGGAFVPRKADKGLQTDTLPFKDFLKASTIIFSSYYTLELWLPVLCSPPADGSLGEVLCVYSEHRVQLLTFHYCCGNCMRVYARATGVFPSRSCLSPPRQVMWSQCHVTVSAGSVPRVYVHTVTHLSTRNTSLQASFSSLYLRIKKPP